MSADAGADEGGAQTTRRYFPEWADLPEQEGTPLEAERNSYSAGGYADEFGYCAHTRFTTLENDPESTLQWHLLIGCVHPGYPACPKPIERDQALPAAHASGSGAPSARRSLTVLASIPVTRLRDFRIIRVEDNNPRKGHRRIPSLWRVLLIRLRRL
jgi:hypothetical protein